MWKRLFSYSILLLCAMLLISCRPGPAAETQRSEGLTVTPHLEKNDTFADALGGGMWHFDITAERTLLCMLEVQEEGKAAISLGGMGLGPSINAHSKIQKTMMVAIVPMGKSLSEADQIKIVQSWEGGSSSRIAANPFRGATVLEYMSPILQEDGTWRLFKVTKQMLPTWRRVTLVCRISHHPSDAKTPRP